MAHLVRSQAQAPCLQDMDPKECWCCRQLSSDTDPTITPCRICCGSMGHIHAACLKEWMSVKQSDECPNCRSRYTCADTLTILRSAILQAAHQAAGPTLGIPIPIDAGASTAPDSVDSIPTLPGSPGYSEQFWRARAAAGRAPGCGFCGNWGCRH